MLSLDRIYKAAHVLKSVIRRTELIPCANITENCQLYIKPENLQVTGSFKIRGSYFKISCLTEEEKARGIVACSAGNHAQGVALAAQKSNIKATIFVPSVAPISKIEATRKYGADVVIIDGVYDDAYNEAIKFVEKTNAVFVHPFDDVDVIAGQGTIGLEILNEIEDLDAIVVPIGGGGLISGLAFAVKTLNPNCKVYGVQAQGAGSMYSAIKKHERVGLDSVKTFADGISVKCPGELTYKLCEKYVDEIVTVSDDETATAILTLMERQRLVSEGAGAVAVAAVMFDKLPIKGKKVCALLSGGNIDVNILARVIGRGLLTTGRNVTLKIEMIDKPGQLKEVATIVSKLGANVVQVRHNYGGENTDLTGCFLHLSLETKNREHINQIINALKEAKYNIVEEKANA
ncbi:MAG: threonine ammonia-lyase [Clostridia bacterium]